MHNIYFAANRCVIKPARLVRDTGKNLLPGQTDDKNLRSMFTLRIYAARVVGASDALTSSCSKVVLPALVSRGFWSESCPATALPFLLCRAASEKDDQL